MDDATAGASDNPCWGGPNPAQHSLEHLINVLVGDDNVNATSSAIIERIKQKLIVFQDENYLVINKPPDLRMDGAYAASVHKLLLYMFPPPSLLPNSCAVSDGDTTGAGSSSNATAPASIEEHLCKLLQRIALLSNHSCLKDDPFRIVHQLDYATSGVLMYAKNKRAAGTACKAFQERQTNKQYVAVVVNSDADATDFPISTDFMQNLPVLSSSCLSQWEDGSLESRFRNKRKRETDVRSEKKNTFNGFMPVHSVFSKWRGSLLRLKKDREECNNDENQSESTPRKRKQKDDNVPPLPEPRTPLTNEEIDEVLSFGPSWKAVKKNKHNHSRCWVTVVETMASEYNHSLEKLNAKKDETIKDGGPSSEQTTPNSSLPPLFRVQTVTDGIDSTICEDSFYICAAIGESKDRFEVIVDPSVSKASSMSTNQSLPAMRPSLTKCTILWRGFMKVDSDTKIAVTKVLLTPWTGRRHQLRVHLAHVAGFPILGDATYGGNIEINSSTSSKFDDAPMGDTRVACRRMCLHAKELTIPLIEGQKQTFRASDPFVIVKSESTEETLVVDGGNN